jgi:large subunit ribosomal protein L3
MSGRRHWPRHGSMQYWPRVKARRAYPKVRSWSAVKGTVLGFIGYKAGMTHVVGIDTGKTSTTKGDEITVPVTVIECPPMKIAGLRLYKRKYTKVQPYKDIMFKLDKHLSRKLTMPKKPQELSLLDGINASELTDVKLLVYTQPQLTGFAKKRPEFMEFGLSGTIDEKIKFVKENHDKELLVNSLFKEGEFVDVHAVTKGKGLQGPVKRFGVDFKPHKTEKGVRRVGTLGAWSGQGHVLYRVPHPGQMGYHTRTEYNKQILRIGTKPEEVNPRGAFPHYGNVKSTYIMIKGSVFGSQKRAIVFTKPIRQKAPESIPTINYVSLEPKS